MDNASTGEGDTRLGLTRDVTSRHTQRGFGAHMGRDRDKKETGSDKHIYFHHLGHALEFKWWRNNISF